MGKISNLPTSMSKLRINLLKLEKEGIVPDGTHHVHAGTDVVEAGHHSRHIGFQGRIRSQRSRGMENAAIRSVHREVAKVR